MDPIVSKISKQALEMKNLYSMFLFFITLLLTFDVFQHIAFFDKLYIIDKYVDIIHVIYFAVFYILGLFIIALLVWFVDVYLKDPFIKKNNDSYRYYSVDELESVSAANNDSVLYNIFLTRKHDLNLRRLNAKLIFYIAALVPASFATPNAFYYNLCRADFISFNLKVYFISATIVFILITVLNYCFSRYDHTITNIPIATVKK